MKKKVLLIFFFLVEYRGFFVLKNYVSCKIKLKNKMLS